MPVTALLELNNQVVAIPEQLALLGLKPVAQDIILRTKTRKGITLSEISAMIPSRLIREPLKLRHTLSMLHEFLISMSIEIVSGKKEKYC
jgi:hypothetical protein